jgi:2-polyprenyl-3-methyl-5-hydroxy-6-metoxy-1,4-benzoquinol methylase
MTEAFSKEQFVKSASDYLGELNQASDFSQIVNIWRSTSIPYSLSEQDPYSTSYRQEVLGLYNDLTGCAYDVKNEWTSTLQSPEEFERGYPWVSGNLAVIAEEIAKPVQVMRALHELGRNDLRVIEFGAGWGHLAIPLAKSGVAMTLVDIDEGFLARAKRIADREGLSVETLCGDFLEVALQCDGCHDVAVFQSSFHHCLEFEKLLIAVRDRVLKPDGQIYFVNEPITSELKFPWGLRYDGESLWAIMCNKWLELGFHHDFFVQLLLRTGYISQALPEIATLYGPGWRAVPGRSLVPFRSVLLPERCALSFHAPDGSTNGRFSREKSTLPPVDGAGMSGWRLNLVNHSLERIAFRIGAEGALKAHWLEPGQSVVCDVMTRGRDLVIEADTFFPSQQSGSSDNRCLGIYVEAASLF